VLRASTLLPLNIPVGKPILSCNATTLIQAQILLDGILYDCKEGSIVLSCPRIVQNNSIIDECREIMNCDLTTKKDSKTVFCTNATLISKNPIICKTATLTKNKNVLNCLHTSTFKTTKRVDGEKVDSKLIQDVKISLKSVFPHELFSESLNKMYLPSQKYEINEMPKDVKKKFFGVFPHELFVSSRSSSQKINPNNRELHTPQKKFEKLPQRFGGDLEDDRLIFSP
jgi:hypothetical protein